MKLNLGCGEQKLDGFINIDMEPDVKPDLVLDFKTGIFPYAESSVDEVWMMHCIEHVERKWWGHVFLGIAKILVPNGILVLSYPEFIKVAQNYIDNKDNDRNFWRAAIYGRQLWPGDYHFSLMDSMDLQLYLEERGFYRVKFTEESEKTHYNTLMCAYKDPAPVNREDILAREIYHSCSHPLEVK